MSNVRFSKDGRVCFDPEAHTYTLDNCVILEGVTSYINRHKNKFDADGKAKEIEVKTGKPAADTLKDPAGMEITYRQAAL